MTVERTEYPSIDDAHGLFLVAGFERKVEDKLWRLTKDQIGQPLSGSPAQPDFLYLLASHTFWSRKVTLRGTGRLS